METTPLPKRQSKRLAEKAALKSKGSEVPTRQWSDIPPELLALVASKLGMIELLGFRGACKDWFNASSSASAEVEASPYNRPWFLLCGEDSKCVLYNIWGKKKYTIDIPEMEPGTTCLASKHGWLLLFKPESIFFFCPFSGAKITLPDFPHNEVSNHVATFSSSPTSEDCIVCVINRTNEFTVELNVLCRGELTWTRYEYSRPIDSLGAVTGAAYYNATFYFLDNLNGALSFSPKKNKWTPYRIVERSNDHTIDTLPFAIAGDYLKTTTLNDSFGPKDGFVISTCGTPIKGVAVDTLIKNESHGSIDASREGGRQLRGVWIMPRFFQISPHQSWSLET